MEQENLNSSTNELDIPVKPDSKNWRALQKDIPGLDIDSGLSRFQNNKSAYVDVLRSYAINTRSLLEALREINRDDLTDFATHVHGLKGSSSSINADEIACLAGALEKAANDSDFDFIKSHNCILAEKANKLISDINELLDEINADNKKPKKDKPDTEILADLCQACKNYDMDSADTALEELDSYDYDTDGELVIWLRESIERINFEEIVEKLQLYL